LTAAQADAYLRELIGRSVAANPAHPGHKRWKVLQASELDRIIRGAMKYRPNFSGTSSKARSEPQPPDDRLAYADKLFDGPVEDVEWVIENMLSPGLTIIAGRPKQGKSWLAMQLLRALKMGEPFLGYAVAAEADGILYAIEDSIGRLARRVKAFTEGYPRVRMRWGAQGNMIDTLNRDYDASQFRIAVIDTLPRGVPYRAGYEEVMADLGPYQLWALERDVALIGILHTSKPLFTKDGNVVERGFDAILGSRGLQAVADSKRRAECYTVEFVEIQKMRPDYRRRILATIS
jgi:hypothetical protein